jgi:hypothetical protein
MADPDRPAPPRLISLTPAAIRAREWRRKKREAVAAADVTNGANDVSNRPNDVAGDAANRPNSPANVTNGAANAAQVRSRRDLAVGAAMVATAVLLAGISMTATTAYSLKSAPGSDRYVIGALALAADVLTLVLPSAAAAAWPRHRGLASVALALWLAAAGTTTLNLAGFIATTADGSIAGRENAATARASVLDQIGRLQAERRTIDETRSAEAILNSVRNASKSRLDSERSALTLAKHRDQIDAELSRLAAVLPTLPAIGEADPAASTVAAAVALLSGGRFAISDHSVERIRVISLLALPLFAGTILAIGAALAERRAT